MVWKSTTTHALSNAVIATRNIATWHIDCDMNGVFVHITPFFTLSCSTSHGMHNGEPISATACALCGENYETEDDLRKHALEVTKIEILAFNFFSITTGAQ